MSAPAAPAKKRNSHLRLPNDGYALCFACLDFAVREENELARHLGKSAAASGAPCTTQAPQHGVVPYELCPVVPARVAAALSSTAKGDVTKLRQHGVDGWWTGVSWVPKCSVASAEEMRGMFVRKGVEVPAWMREVTRVSLIELTEEGELVE